jgi:hypothetical protein
VFTCDLDMLVGVDQNLQPAKKQKRYKPAALQQLERQQAREQLVVDVMTSAAVFRDATVSWVP